MPFVEANGRRLSYVRRGSGEPLLLIMGLSGHHQVWGEPFLAALAAEYDVVAFDHRGIGESDRAEAEFSITDLADDAAGVIEGIGWTSAHVFGISLGGMVAQQLALRHPELVRTLAIGCSYAGGRGSTMESPGLPRVLSAMMTHDPDLVARAGFEANVSPAYTADPAHFEEFKRNALAVKVPVPVVMMQAQAAAAHDTSAALPSLRVPTLVIHGTADEMLLFGNGEQIASLIPGARFELFEGVGHLFWLEDQDRTVRLLRELTSVSTADRSATH
jgi:pimeloyl-ACP methyl ester carboxylesterase